MFEIADDKGPILEVHASGELTQEDYRDVLVPALERFGTDRGDMRLLILFAPGITELSLSGLGEVARFVMSAPSLKPKIATVGRPNWIHGTFGKQLAAMKGGEFRAFAREDADKARAWLAG